MTGRSDRVAAARIFREEAEREGFSRVGIARAQEPPGFARFSDWIASGAYRRKLARVLVARQLRVLMGR